jgi:hypothetical protein
MLRGDAGEKETFDSVLSLKYFIQAVKFSWSTLTIIVAPWEAIWPTVSTSAVGFQERHGAAAAAVVPIVPSRTL